MQQNMTGKRNVRRQPVAIAATRQKTPVAVLQAALLVSGLIAVFFALALAGLP